MTQTLPVVPGKLMIAGEYAVLQPEGLALALATGHLVETTLGAHPVPDVSLHAFGQSWPVTPSSQGLAAFAAAALQLALRTWELAPQHSIDLHAHGQVAGAKVGLGTSAAVTVATLRAVLASNESTRSAIEIADMARQVHHAVQGGRGSGYDVTTIAVGGCIAYARSPDRATPLHWPQDLAAAAFFTGEPAPTADALQRQAAMTPALPAIRDAAARLLDAWQLGDPESILQHLQQCETALDAAAALAPGLITPAVETTRQFLRDHGLVARTSGAGGGDCVLGFGAPDAVEAAVTAWQTRGGIVVAQLPHDLALRERS